MSQLFQFGKGIADEPTAAPVFWKAAPTITKAEVISAGLDRDLAALEEKRLIAEAEAAALLGAEPEGSKLPLYIGLGVGGLALLGLLALLVKPKSVSGYRRRRRSRRRR